MEKETKIVNIDYNFTDLKLYFEKFKEKQELDYQKNKTSRDRLCRNCAIQRRTGGNQELVGNLQQNDRRKH